MTEAKLARMVDYVLNDEDPRLAQAIRRMTPAALRHFACECAALAVARSGLVDVRVEAAITMARRLGTPNQPRTEVIESLRAEVQRIFQALDRMGFDTLAAHEAGRGPSYEDYLEATHKACAAESALYALREDPLHAAVSAFASSRWTTPPCVELEDYLQAAELAMMEPEKANE